MKPRIVVIGSLNLDIVVETDNIPLQGETVFGKQAHFVPGGKGANQAVALARLGAEVNMIGAVGSDAFGAELRASLQAEGIGVDAVKRMEQTSTGIALIQVNQQDNRITVVPGANSCLTPADLEQHEEMLAAAELVLLQMEIPLQTVVHAVKMAKRLGKTVVLNPAPAQRLPDELLRDVDYITPNRTELAVLTNRDPTEQMRTREDLREGMEALASAGAKHVLTTLGAEGVACLGAGGVFRICPGFAVTVVDTTGAGDAFNAGLAFAVATNRELSEAVRFASKVAALSVTKLGAQAGMPTWDEVMTKGKCLHEKVSD